MKEEIKKLKRKILNEMVITNLEFEIWKEIGHRYQDFDEFHKDFQKTLKGVSKKWKKKKSNIKFQIGQLREK